MYEPKVGEKFKDAHYDTWIYIGGGYVRRLKDGNIGGWNNGQGLEKLQ